VPDSLQSKVERLAAAYPGIKIDEVAASLQITRHQTSKIILRLRTKGRLKPTKKPKGDPDYFALYVAA
jgi:transposase